MKRRLSHRLTLALFASMIGCGGTTFRCDPSPSWSGGPSAMNDAAMPACTASNCSLWTLATGARHTCAVVGSEFEVVCWGANEVGQSDWRAPGEVVLPTRINQRVFSAASPAYAWLDASELRTCAAALDRIVCWGGSPRAPEVLAMRFDGLLEVGLDDVCAFTPDGSECLSGAQFGFLGGATRVEFRDGARRLRGIVPGPGLLRTRPSFEMELPVGLLAVGALHSCVREFTTDATLCVGRGDRGQLGTRYVPTDAPEGTRIPTLIGSTDTTCVGGHLGARWTPEGIVTEGPLGGHTCRIFPRETGPDVAGVYCMGANDRGQLGLGVSVDTNAFRRVEGLPNQSIRQVYCGGEYTCARTNTELFCWGDNRYGQLGIDPSIRAYSAVPVRIDLASAFTR